LNNLTFSDYQAQALTTAVFSDKIGLPYLALGIAGEAGEQLQEALRMFVLTSDLDELLLAIIISIQAGRIAERVKKQLRDGGDWQQFVQTMKKELGDGHWYAAVLEAYLGLDSADVAQANLDKLAKRLKTNTLHGSGSNREENAE
jgi:hypothetical protein